MSPKLYVPGWVQVSNARCLVASMLKSQRTKHCKSQHIWIWLAGELPGMVQNCFDCADVLPRHRNAFNGLSFLHRSRFPVMIYADRFCIFQETQRTKAFDSTYVGKVSQHILCTQTILKPTGPVSECSPVLLHVYSNILHQSKRWET